MISAIGEKERKKIAEELSHLLADSYTLYLRTHNYHWNVTGPQFSTLHALFEQQYTELALAVDKIAERIRTLGFPAPGTFSEFAELASIKEERGMQNANHMLKMLNESQEAILKTIRKTYSVANEFHDMATVDLLSQRIQIHEKTAWMIRSLLA
jgi:starvation-inducible DNA-binding protein